MMSEENTGTNDESQVSGKFAMIPNEILGMLGKNVRTPAGTVEKIDGDDLAWWGFFFTFRYQKKPCYQNRNTISDRFDCDVKTVTRRTSRLENLGLLEIKPRKGTSNIYTAASVEEFLAMRTREKVTPKTEEKQGNGKSKPQAEQEDPKVATAATPPEDEPAKQNPGLDSGSAAPVVGQQSGVESDPEHGGDDRADGADAVNQNHDTDAPFPPEKPASEETAGRVIAPLDDLRYWSDIGYEGMDDYGVMWGVSGDDLDNLIREHLKIREAEAEKNFKSQRAH
ncbi:hypothetical protein N5J30_17490 [Klebsiella michiganensis]|uniref:hypothetical protein n=1 Tax=Klebsiella michiganensis TaxID=1134687 RepID=UPI002447D128|nr:hypothetical protein [Klebsiella michiganensis]MDH1972419.1 hypothetical protein [Klebsiella michiganensis]